MKSSKGRDFGQRGRQAPGSRPAPNQLLLHAIEKFRAGLLIEARALAEAAVRQSPRDPEALNVAGTIFTRLGDYRGVANILGRKIEMAPQVARLRSNYSLALRLLFKPKEAADQAREAIRLDPRDATGHDNLCAALMELGDMAEAETAGREAVRLAPTNAHIRVNYANALAGNGKAEEAEAALLEATRIAPSEPDPWSSLGRLCQSQARYEDALNAVRRTLELRYPTEWWPAPGAKPVNLRPMPEMTNTLKLRHDIEQLEYLAARNRLPAGAERFAPIYKRALGHFIQKYGPAANAPFTPGEWAEIGSAYNRILVWDPPARIADGALGSFDRAAATQRYAVPPGIIWIDDFLKGEAVTALRRFCLEATIWNDIQHNFQDRPVARGYLGTSVTEGLVAPLLFQIADELTRALPDIFRHHRLTQMWAYKYAPELEGISLHGDVAAVNVNFWITPDDANLEPESGGLLVYPVEAPADWDFRAINLDHDRMRKYLDESGCAPVNVPYRENRAVIFNSDLFHATSPLRFKPGYENRRINITMLFGERSG